MADSRSLRIVLTPEDAAVAAVALRDLVPAYAEEESLLRVARWLEAIHEEVLGVVYR